LPESEYRQSRKNVRENVASAQGKINPGICRKRRKKYVPWDQ
jgi:hypothetical protein